MDVFFTFDLSAKENLHNCVGFYFSFLLSSVDTLKKKEKKSIDAMSKSFTRSNDTMIQLIFLGEFLSFLKCDELLVYLTLL
jgi:hypothetical protein